MKDAAQVNLKLVDMHSDTQPGLGYSSDTGVQGIVDMHSDTGKEAAQGKVVHMHSNTGVAQSRN